MYTMMERYKAIRGNAGANAYPHSQVRDLLLFEMTENLYLVVASDSCGGIGPKEGDTAPCPGYDLGRLAARVPMMEMVAANVVPIFVVDTLSVEMEPTGVEIIKGVRDEVATTGLDTSGIITGSTEDNVPTTQTGVGIVAVGVVSKRDFKPGGGQKGDVVVAVGKPKTAPVDRVIYSDSEIADVECVSILSKLDFVHDVLPVGSKGIVHEISELAKSASLSYEYLEKINIDIKKSGGPSTCVLVALPQDKVEEVRKSVKQPVFEVGVLL